MWRARRNQEKSPPEIYYRSVWSAGPTPFTVAAAAAAVARGNAAVLAEIEAAAKTVGGLSEAYDAMMTAIAWNVNFDPRVAVTGAWSGVLNKPHNGGQQSGFRSVPRAQDAPAWGARRWGRTCSE